MFSTILVQRQQYTLNMGSSEFVSSCKNNVIKEGETMRHCMQKKWTMTADLLKKTWTMTADLLKKLVMEVVPHAV